MLYSIWCPDRGEDEGEARGITAINAEEAAREWAERDARHDPAVVDGHLRTGLRLHLRCPDGMLRVATVKAEAAVQYWIDIEET